MRSLAGSALLLGAAVFSCLGDNVMDIHAEDHRAGQESGGVRRRVDPHQRGAGARMAARFLLLSDLSAYGGGDGMPRKSFEWHGDLGVLFLSVHVCGCVVAGGCFA